MKQLAHPPFFAPKNHAVLNSGKAKSGLFLKKLRTF
jgi:hypothetical protein